MTKTPVAINWQEFYLNSCDKAETDAKHPSAGETRREFGLKPEFTYSK
jgi:hypothetical protein